MANQPGPPIKESLSRRGDEVVHTVSAEGGTPVSVVLTFEQIRELIREAKAPDADTQEKKQNEEVRRKARLEQMLSEANLQERNARMQQSQCGHKKQDGESTVRGQIHSDGLVHPICLRCQKMFTPYEPPRELIAGMGF